MRQSHRIIVNIDLDVRLTLGVLLTARPERSNNRKSLTIFTSSSILNLLQGSEYISVVLML